MAHRPTEEQEAILAAFATGAGLIIEAAAGTGKTSTLEMMARTRHGNRPSVYLAYNKALQAEAAQRFPDHVTCRTAHSQAFGVGRLYRQRLNARAFVSNRELAGILGAPRVEAAKVLQPGKVARLAYNTVLSWCQTADDEIGRRHVPLVLGMDDPLSRSELERVIVPLARRAWSDLVRTDAQGGGRLNFQHDVYLKLYQLSRPRIDAEVVYFDEAQDANPVLEAIVRQQRHSQVVLVGDRNQQLYSWRGAVDSMSRLGGRRMMLTQSFRFGQAIADEANRWLVLLPTDMRLRGLESIHSELREVSDPDVVICRTNAGAVTQVMRSTASGVPTALVGGGGQIKSYAKAALQLQAGLGCDLAELSAFTTWGEFLGYVRELDEEESGSGELGMIVRLIETVGAQKLVDALDRLPNETSAKRLVTTGHKFKGREGRRVLIGEDFAETQAAKAILDRTSNAVPEAAAMLAYVAVTRACEKLDRGGLRYIDMLDKPLAGRTA